MTKSNDAAPNGELIVHLIDGTYELFRHFYGLRRFNKGEDRPFGAVIGVLNTVLQMIETGATHVGVATDHVIESFRNALWAGYKTGEGMDPLLYAQFQPLEEALRALGVPPASIPDWLALVGDSADGYPGLPGWGARSAAAVLARYRHLEHIPKLATEWDVSVRGALRLATTLAEQRERALLFRELATLRTDAPLGVDVDALRWRGPRAGFTAWATRLGAPQLHARAAALARATALY